MIASNIGIAANNQSNTLAQSIGFSVYASEAADLSRLDDPQRTNSWLAFSAPLSFYWPEGALRRSVFCRGNYRRRQLIGAAQRTFQGPVLTVVPGSVSGETFPGGR